MEERSSDGWRDVLLARLQDAMWGYGGQNGVVGSTKDHGQRITKLENFQRDLESLRDFAKWLALGICGLIGFLLTDPVARVVVAVAAALK